MELEKYELKRRWGIQVTLHGLRHACATRLLEQGAELRAVQELLGHRCLRSTQVYLHQTPIELQRVHRQYHPRA